MVNITFNCNNEEKTFEYDNSLKIEDMLKDFLKKTHSKLILETEKIIFLCKAKIINRNPFLTKTLGQMFKDNNMVKVKVMEKEPIIGTEPNIGTENNSFWNNMCYIL